MIPINQHGNCDDSEEIYSFQSIKDVILMITTITDAFTSIFHNK
jgi:hypothetical protein